MSRPNQRVAYLNGEILPESEVRIPFRDRGFRWGDGCYDQARTFNHQPFKLKEHIERFYRSLRYLRIDPRLSPTEMLAVTEEVLGRNLNLLSEDEDYWVIQRVTRGVDGAGGEAPVRDGPTVLVECMPLPYKQRAHLYRDGIELETVSIRRTPPNALSPRAKMNNYLNHFLADEEVRGRNPRGWALFQDMNGNIAEGTSSNFFLADNGVLRTPRAQFVLGGVSRQTVIELAEQEGIPFEESDLDLYDVANADEIFLTMTSLCICPVSQMNGMPVGDGSVPGPITRTLMNAFARLVDCDFVLQFQRRLS